MKVKPLHDRVLVKRLDTEEMTKGGIIIPDTAQEKPMEGQVIAIGKGKILDDGSVKPPNVKVKDKVLFSKYGGTEISLGGEDLIILKEDDILAIVE